MVTSEMPPRQERVYSSRAITIYRSFLSKPLFVLIYEQESPALRLGPWVNFEKSVDLMKVETEPLL